MRFLKRKAGSEHLTPPSNSIRCHQSTGNRHQCVHSERLAEPLRSDYETVANGNRPLFDVSLCSFFEQFSSIVGIGRHDPLVEQDARVRALQSCRRWCNSLFHIDHYRHAVSGLYLCSRSRVHAGLDRMVGYIPHNCSCTGVEHESQELTPLVVKNSSRNWNPLKEILTGDLHWCRCLWCENLLR